MAKKKSKVVSNRGYATVSAPKKPPVIEAPVVETPTVEPVQEQPIETAVEDPIAKLLKKYESLHDHKAQVAIDRMENSEPPVEQPKSFRLPDTLERDLLQVLSHEESNMFAQTRLEYASEYEKEKMIAQLDILYRTCIKLGFSTEDISASFRATVSRSLEDHLDWLCVHVPYERMPVGFYDKYFNQEDEDQLIFMHNNHTKHETPVEPVQGEEKLVLIKEKPVEQDTFDVKSRVLQAAQQYLEEEEQDINDQYATVKLQITELNKLIHPKKESGKKNKNALPVVVLTEAELEKARKDVKKLNDKLYSIEADWDFDKSKGEALYLQKVQLHAEETKKMQIEARNQLKKEAEERIKAEQTAQLEEEEEEDSMFGGLMMDDELDTAATPTSTTPAAVIQWNMVDLTVPKSWMGRYPKDLLLEHCNKQLLGKQKYHAKNMGSGIWQASLEIKSEDRFNHITAFELPKDMGADNKHDAEQLVALYALFELDYQSSVYKVLPNTYKDVWIVWLEKKIQEEEGPRIEADKQRLAFLVELVDNSVNTSNPDNNSTSASLNNTTQDQQTTRSNPISSKNRAMFARVKDNFKSRQDKKDYLEMKKKRSTLPISAYREEILEFVKHNQVLIISGETGCGKSTQVPQFLAEDILGGACQTGSVVCTQPRRISAMSIANRVSTEMGDRPRSTGSKDAMVGYQIRLESKMSEENVLLFCTTGILLRRLESDAHLKGVTHVVVDEVHERTIESDFLLIILKKLLQTRSDLKVILMSATVEASRFSEYFGGCPVVSVPGRTYPVHVQYLDDVIEDTGYVLEEDSPFAIRKYRVKSETGNINVSGQHGSSKNVRYELYADDSDDDPYDPTHIESKLTIVDNNSVKGDEEEDVGRTYSRQTRRMIKRMDDKKINYDLILELLDHICKPKKEASKTEETKPLESTAEADTMEPSTEFKIPDQGAILVFLPGMNEIRKLYDLVSSHSTFGDPSKFLLIALHSALTSENQEKAFDVPPNGVRKIVFSTNIAETGVTISDVTIVIDTGMAKMISYDDKKRVTKLLQKYIAKANARQRRGRAGRVQEGVCFHLFTQQKYEEMANYETPEILRLPLEELCLRIKVCGLGSIRDVLGAALDAPSQKMISNAILTLQEVQALSLQGETLTPLGAHLSSLPVDVHIGKMILFGAIFKCLDPVLTIAAALSFKSPFVRPFGKEDEADTARARFHVDNSDFFTIYKAYDIWREEYMFAMQSKTSNSAMMRHMHKFCKENFLSQQNLEMIEDMKKQYLSLLISIGFVKTNVKSEFNQYDLKRKQLCQVPGEYNENSDSMAVVNAALTAGLYPKIAEYKRKTNQIVNKSMELKIHPSSTLAVRKNSFLSDFLIYNTVVMNNNNNRDNVYMWETASVDAVAVVLLATHIDIKYKQRRMILDEWVHFDCFARTAVLLKFLRKQLNKWLTAKMDQPGLDLGEYTGDVMDVLVKTLEANAY